MNAPSVDIVEMLEDASSLGLTFITNLFIGKEPSEPDDCVTIFDTDDVPLLTLDGDGGYYYSSVQIRVRSKDYVTGWDLIKNIQLALHGKEHKIWGVTLYTVIYCSSGPALLDWDENKRVRFIINFNLQRR